MAGSPKQALRQTDFWASIWHTVGTMLWAVLCMGLSWPAAGGPNPLMAGVFFRVDRDILRAFGPCEHVSADPPTAHCHPKVFGRPTETIFVFDETHRVHAVLLAFPPAPNIDGTQDLMKATVGALSEQFGPPSVQKVGAGAVWSWNNEHGVAVVKLTKTEREEWLVTATLKEGALPERYSK